MTQEPTVETLDSLFESLSNRQCRRLLYYLREQESATKSELVDALTGWAATDRPDSAAPRETWARMQTRLHHVYLPRLKKQDLVTDDPETDVVTLTELAPWIDRCLDAAFESDQRVANAADRQTASILEQH